ncbi:hypothetical protein INS17_00195 [Staphylococcus haemolyticus]|uniref:hypothetical protein n=1 Tax=Staphylococcus haemolyticus TaxID=1283 RepID=UPI00187A70DC|nr:hypothetical protein [Staphylococcus haemolyticus]MBE7354949.1 hypothetical protein [Staphylococcus haemolyticus]
MASVLISVCSVILSLFSFLVAYLNRLDNFRPHLYSYIKDQRNDEGDIDKEFIVIKNYGKVPGLINNINLIADTKIYSSNKQYVFEQPVMPAKNNHIDIDKVLKNRCKNKTILPDHSIVIEIRNVAVDDKNDLEKLETLNEVMEYGKGSLQNVEGEISIKIEYKKAKKPCLNNKSYFTECVIKQ